ncbi:MAG: hypothetical protein PVH11_13765 [Anaerolineae bacterium]|jgi:hypothetical protein
MKTRWRFRTVVPLLALALLVGSVALAESGDGPATLSGASYDLAWSTVDGGGYTFSTGGNFALGGTAGQPDAGLMTGGDYALGGGFWGGGAWRLIQGRVYLPVVVRQDW